MDDKTLRALGELAVLAAISSSGAGLLTKQRYKKDKSREQKLDKALTSVINARYPEFTLDPDLSDTKEEAKRRLI